jgi:ribonuclease BN (tRNA processing enzyme)
MPWNLSIETIDVGQGESSFIKTWTDDGQHTRTMLIDGGLADRGITVHNHVINSIRDQETSMGMQGIFHVDRIMVSHFDADHSGGIIKILEADNFYKLCDIITGHVMQSIAAFTNQSLRIHIITTAAAACTAVICGAYNNLHGQDYYWTSDSKSEKEAEYITFSSVSKSVSSGTNWDKQYFLSVRYVRDI